MVPKCLVATGPFLKEVSPSQDEMGSADSLGRFTDSEVYSIKGLVFNLRSLLPHPHFFSPLKHPFSCEDNERVYGWRVFILILISIKWQPYGEMGGWGVLLMGRISMSG